jgi:hypothetical protein
MKKFLKSVSSISLLAVLAVPMFATAAEAKTIVVYGDTMAGVAAAAKAAANAPSHQVILIAPGTSTKLGGLGTVGGQNFYDTKIWYSPNTGTWDHPQKGTFAWWYSQVGQFYNTDTLADRMATDLAKYSNLSIIWNYDIESMTTVSSPFRVTGLNLRNVYRNSSTGYVNFGTSTRTVTGDVFIDASDEGRLARLSNWGGTTGRYDWPSTYLDSDETGANGKARQQAATLMFKVKNITWPTGVSFPYTNGDMTFIVDSSTGARAMYGGKNTLNTSSIVKSFNDTWGPQGFAIKPMNIAENGPSSVSNGEWWVNALLVFNVDGRAYEKDRGTSRFPSDMRSDYKTVDQAWVAARDFIAKPEFLTALRQFNGLQNVQLVYDLSGKPVVGEVMYLRETIHNSNYATNNANGTENSNYELTTSESIGAGTGPSNGSDIGNYSTRIGLSFYNSDINAYKFSDMKNSSGSYIWPVTDALRPDLASTPAKNPAYVPYKALTTNYVANLLLPGYAVGTSSYGWSEHRVLPNLTVFGDAAGVAAAHAVNTGVHPLYFTSSDISSVQSKLISAGARLDK